MTTQAQIAEQPLNKVRSVAIDDLQNLVFEGGGGKGTVYVGAIAAIERRLLALDVDSDDVPRGARVGPAILDHYINEAGGQRTRIRRFAGSSAGAITSFALALGLSAKQIEDVCQYPFTQFLQATHCGKYRMVSNKLGICIGEDKAKTLGAGDGTRKYVFKLDKQQHVQPSLVKWAIRRSLLELALKTLAAGIADTFDDIVRFFSRFDTARPGSFQQLAQSAQAALEDVPGLQVYKWLSTFWRGHDPKQAGRWWSWKVVVAVAVQVFARTKLKSLSADSDMNIKLQAIANVIADRGMFSGFAVREFFFDLMLFACTNDTHFQRSAFNIAEREALNGLPKWAFKGGRTSVDFSGLKPNLRQRLESLPDITFKQFYELTGVSLIICVSNFTSDAPVYFSEYWTPEFRIMEAVGASMAIPPAIKPVYNEADVYSVDSGSVSYTPLSPSPAGNSASDSTSDKPTESFGPRVSTQDRVWETEKYFSYEDYNKEIAAIKSFLTNQNKAWIDTNTPINMSGYLPLLREQLEQSQDGASGNLPWTSDIDSGFSVPGNFDPLVVTRQILSWHYNAAFKGLLLDGGYRCNIPYNIFRTGASVLDGDLSHTLALKLDNVYPDDWLINVYRKLDKEVENLEALNFLEGEQHSVLGQIMALKMRSILHSMSDDDRESSPLFTIPDLKGLNADSYYRIAANVVRAYKDRMVQGSRPWNKQKSLLSTAMEGYSYGSEDGQIRYTSDHAHIISLYSYGIGTFDFDPNKYVGLVNLAKQKALEKVDGYFDQ